MNVSTKVLIIAGVGLAAVIGLTYGARRLGSAAGNAAAAVADLFNPTSSSNLAYRGANAFTQAVTNDPYATLGTALWKWNNPEALRKEAQMGVTPWSEVPAFYTAIDREDADYGLYMREANLENPAGPSFWNHMRQ